MVGPQLSPSLFSVSLLFYVFTSSQCLQHQSFASLPLYTSSSHFGFDPCHCCFDSDLWLYHYSLHWSPCFTQPSTFSRTQPQFRLLRPAFFLSMCWFQVQNAVTWQTDQDWVITHLEEGYNLGVLNFVRIGWIEFLNMVVERWGKPLVREVKWDDHFSHTKWKWWWDIQMKMSNI